MKRKTPLELAAEEKEPWKGIMTKENYDKLTRGMSKSEKADLNLGLVTRDANCLMSLGAMGMYEPAKKRGGTGRKKNGAKN